MTTTAPLWGIDLGGTKIEGVILSEADPSAVLARIRIDTEAEKGYRHVVERIGEMVRLLEQKSGLKRPAQIGMGTPGTIDPSSGTMKNCNTTSLNGEPLKRDVEESTGAGFVIANDANCFALAEATMGAAKGHEVVFGVILGTGVGGGIVVRDHVLTGLEGIAGEWGHIVVDTEGPACYCGRNGCVETFISGPALERFYVSRSGEQRRLKEIVERAVSGKDEAARATVARLVSYFSRSIAYVINILDPDVIVLGGGVGNVAALYRDVPKELGRHIFNNRVETPFVRPILGDSAGVFGAAMLTAGFSGTLVPSIP